MPYDNLKQATAALATAIRDKAEALTFSPTSETVDLLEGAALVKASQQVESMVSLLPDALQDGTSADWTRSDDWLPMPTLTQADNTFAGLFAVFPLGGNLVALKAKGAYTVDWGDGVVENFANDALAEHEFNYNAFDATNATLTSGGYKQVIIKVYPQAGQTLTDLNLAIKHTKIAALPTPAVNFLDVKFYSSSCVNFFMEHTSRISTRTVKLVMLKTLELSTTSAADLSYLLHSNQAIENLVIKESIVSSSAGLAYAFQSCSALKAIYIDVTCPSLTQTFSSCWSLSRVDRFNIIGNSVSLTSCFASCASLRTLPDLVFIGSVTLSSAFLSSGLIETPNITAASATADSAFSSCISLVRSKIFNFGVCTSYSSMFSGCVSLSEVAPITLAGWAAISMFATCRSLRKPPQLTVAANMSLSAIFSSSGIRESKHSEWLTCTATITDMGSMYGSCENLEFVEIDNWYGCSAISGMVSSSSVARIVAPPLPAGLSSIPTSSFSPAVGRLTSLSIPGWRYSFSVASQRLSAAALNAIFNGLATVSPAQTITVTGNYGINELGYDPTIATAKGWTVTA